MKPKLSKQEWREWQESKVTLAFIEAVKDAREEYLQALTNGVFAEDPGRQNIVIGKINAYTSILAMDLAEGEETNE